MLNLLEKALAFMCLQYKSSENTVGKGEIAHNEQFLLFPQCFLHSWENFQPFLTTFEIVVCKLIQFGLVQNIVAWERVKTWTSPKLFYQVKS